VACARPGVPCSARGPRSPAGGAGAGARARLGRPCRGLTWAVGGVRVSVGRLRTSQRLEADRE